MTFVFLSSTFFSVVPRWFSLICLFLRFSLISLFSSILFDFSFLFDSLWSVVSLRFSLICHFSSILCNLSFLLDSLLSVFLFDSLWSVFSLRFSLIWRFSSILFDLSFLFDFFWSVVSLWFSLICRFSSILFDMLFLCDSLFTVSILYDVSFHVDSLWSLFSIIFDMSILFDLSFLFFCWQFCYNCRPQAGDLVEGLQLLLCQTSRYPMRLIQQQKKKIKNNYALSTHFSHSCFKYCSPCLHLGNYFWTLAVQFFTHYLTIFYI